MVAHLFMSSLLLHILPDKDAESDQENSRDDREDNDERVVLFVKIILD